MKKLIAYIFVSVALISALSSCQKTYEWTIPLAVNSTALTLPTTGDGYFFMPIYSSVQWELTIKYEEGTPTEWLHPSVTTGKGQYTNVKFNYDKNFYSAARHADVIITAVEAAGDTMPDPITVTLTQKAGD